ncbi:MAG: hypothetical protein JW789_00940 [Candidatus Aenigmarchaeota archaeon]|nr:hypothetical protein [Candidatus Aenigmarchaeota archaeon]
MALEIVEILKWAAVIFVAGFIGYFGKYLSKLVLARVHKSGPEGAKSTSEKPAKTREEIEYILEKKRMKIEKKRAKSLKKAKSN